MWAKSKRRTLLSAGLIFGASFFSYLSSLDGDFVFDDHRGILTNDDLNASKTSLFDLFQHDFWGGHMSRVESHKSYRPLTVLTYRYFNFYFSELRPYSYHLVNVLLHCMASLLFMCLSELVIGGKGADVTCLGLPLNWPTFAALLFAVHSIHTEAVSYDNKTNFRTVCSSSIIFLSCTGDSSINNRSPVPPNTLTYMFHFVYACTPHT